jgi:hypothetical protein
MPQLVRVSVAKEGEKIVNEFVLVAFGAESLDKLSRQVFVEQYSHAAWSRPPWARSRIVLRTDSLVRLG